MIRQRWTPEREVEIPSPHTFCSCTRPHQLNSQLCVCQDLSISFLPIAVQVSALCLRRTDILTLCDWRCAFALRVATAVRGKESRCVSIPQSLHCAHHTLRDLEVTEDIHHL